MQQRMGLPVEVLSPAEVSGRWPHIEPERLIGATWCPTDGFLHPHIIYGEGFRRTRELGVDVRQGIEVIGARLRKGGASSAWRRQTVRSRRTGSSTRPTPGRHGSAARLGGMPLSIAPTKRYLYHMKVNRPIMPEEALRRLPMTIYGMGPGRGAHSRPDGPQLILAWGTPHRIRARLFRRGPGSHRAGI